MKSEIVQIKQVCVRNVQFLENDRLYWISTHT